jgi:hypothetical protein
MENHSQENISHPRFEPSTYLVQNRCITPALFKLSVRNAIWNRYYNSLVSLVFPVTEIQAPNMLFRICRQDLLEVA